MELNIKYISNSKKGIGREKNQDRILIIEKDSYYLFMIFDGVSSYPLSYLFINEFKKKVRCKTEKLQVNETNLNRILFETNYDVLNSGITGMSTLSVLFFNKLANEISFINIGDSRIYIFNNQYLEKVTSDDSLPGRENIITKCLGMETLSFEDFNTKNVDIGYNYLLCTDGFYRLMEENIKEYFNTFNFKNIRNIEKKILLLQRRKNRDDSSYIIIKNEISN